MRQPVRERESQSSPESQRAEGGGGVEISAGRARRCLARPPGGDVWRWGRSVRALKAKLGTLTFALLLLAGATVGVVMFQREGIADIIRGVSLLGGAIGILGGWRLLGDARARFQRDGPSAILEDGWVPPLTAAALTVGSTLAVVFAYYGLEAAGRVLRSVA